MPRKKRIWRDIRDIHFQLNYDTDPEVATFVHEFGNSSLARLIKNLLYQHLVSTAHATARREYCAGIRVHALMQQLNPDAGSAHSPAAGINAEARPAAVTVEGVKLEAPSSLVFPPMVAGPEASMHSPLPVVSPEPPKAIHESAVSPHGPAFDQAGRPQVLEVIPVTDNTAGTPRYTGPNNKLLNHFLKD
ncbi:hypothetical protein CRM94_17480 [Burkholderia gladioli]|uniref:Uncharacterized protein n=1 Tax=Burkholderia gladioli TaxID=28095 RepID=A0A2A7SBA1_BURGA|nr:hypothetical protein [Burkholderia gladioli]PEH40500.1 hypothetical protein CRM94_17480 [Burkholderia gladioli]